MVRAALADTDQVVASDLTLVECDRGLIRARADRRLRNRETAALHETFAMTASRWGLLRLSPAIVERARQPFPGDPLRALDALHLATALALAETVTDLAVLSLDRRVRDSARALGFDVIPAL